MLELFFLKLCSSLLLKQVSLHELSDEELKMIFLVQTPTSGLDVKTLDIERKKEIDRLIIEWGPLVNLVKLAEFQEDIKKLKFVLMEKKDRGPVKIYNNLYFLGVAAKDLYERVERLYLPNILYILYESISKCETGNFDGEFFRNHVQNDRIGLPTVLGFDPEAVEYENIVLDETLRENSSDYAPLANSLLDRDNITKGLAIRIANSYSREEVEDCLKQLIDTLSERGNPEFQEIIKMLFKAGEYIEDIRSTLAKRSKREDQDVDQCTIMGF